jgi:hypothetical protein
MEEQDERIIAVLLSDVSALQPLEIPATGEVMFCSPEHMVSWFVEAGKGLPKRREIATRKAAEIQKAWDKADEVWIAKQELEHKLVLARQQEGHEGIRALVESPFVKESLSLTATPDE